MALGLRGPTGFIRTYQIQCLLRPSRPEQDVGLRPQGSRPPGRDERLHHLQRPPELPRPAQLLHRAFRAEPLAAFHRRLDHQFQVTVLQQEVHSSRGKAAEVARLPGKIIHVHERERRCTHRHPLSRGSRPVGSPQNGRSDPEANPIASAELIGHSQQLVASRPAVVAAASSYAARVRYRAERPTPRCAAMAVTDSLASRRRRATASMSPSTAAWAAAVVAVRRGGVQADQGPLVDELPLDLCHRGEHDEEDLRRRQSLLTPVMSPTTETSCRQPLTSVCRPTGRWSSSLSTVTKYACFQSRYQSR